LPLPGSPTSRSAFSALVSIARMRERTRRSPCDRRPIRCLHFGLEIGEEEVVPGLPLVEQVEVAAQHPAELLPAPHRLALGGRRGGAEPGPGVAQAHQPLQRLLATPNQRVEQDDEAERSLERTEGVIPVSKTFEPAPELRPELL
jgi:hypothetical protein